MIAGGIGLGVWLCGTQEKRLGLPKDTAVDFALWAVPAAIIGARVYYVAFQWDLYKDDLLRAFRLWEGGIAIYGAVIGGALGAMAYAKKKKLSFGALADMTAPALILGQAIGRWGNFVNQEAYGALIENPALQFFPLAVYADGAWRMATFFYESVWNFIGFFVLWLNRKKTVKPGDLFLKYLCWYGVGRAVIEGLRTDSLMWGSVRVSQALSVLLVIAAGALLILHRKQAKTEI